MGEAKDREHVVFHLTRKEQVVIGNILIEMEVKTRVDRRNKEACISDLRLDWIVDVIEDNRVDDEDLAVKVEKHYDSVVGTLGKRNALVDTINMAIRKIRPFDEMLKKPPVVVRSDKTVMAWLLEQLDKLNQGKDEKIKVSGTRDIFLARVEARIAAAKEGIWKRPPELLEEAETTGAPDVPAAG